MVNGIGLTSESIARPGACGGWRLVSTMSWWRLEGFRKVTEGGLLRRSWIDGSKERIWKPSLRIHLRR